MPTEQTIKELVNSAILKAFLGILGTAILLSAGASAAWYKTQRDIDELKSSVDSLRLTLAQTNTEVRAVASKTAEITWVVDGHEKRLAWVERRRP